MFDKNQYILRNAVEAEDAGSRGTPKLSYRVLEELSGGTKPRPVHCWTMTKSHDEEIKRWKQHFEWVVNCDGPETCCEEDLEEKVDIEELEIHKGDVIKNFDSSQRS